MRVGADPRRSHFKRTVPWIDVRSYGAQGNAQLLTSCSISSTVNPNVLNCGGGSFQQSDVGKAVQVAQAGTSGGTLLTYIKNINSGTQITG